MKILSLNITIFLSILLHFFMPASAMEQEILELRNGIRTITQRVQTELDRHPNTQSVVILGPTGSGKTTLVNLLANRQAVVQQGYAGLRVHVNNPLPGFDIEHQNIAGTKHPGSWYDAVNDTVFWDCPGFGDPRGAPADILNAFSIHKLFRPNTKILLIAPEDALRVDRATGFVTLLNEVTALFPDNPHLKGSLSVVISRQRDIPNIPNYLREDILPPSQQQQAELTPSVRDLLQFLVTHPERISFFQHPIAPGQYAPNMQPVRGAIFATNYMMNPTPRIHINPAASVYLGALGRSLNNSITEYMGNYGNTLIISHCNQLIDSYPGPVEQLRTTFRTLATNLRNLQNTVRPQNPNLFPQELTRMFGNQFNVNEINQTIEHLRFFREINNNVTYHTADWINPLLQSIQQVHALITLPQISFGHVNHLIIEGKLVGVSDIRRAIATTNNPIYGIIIVGEDFFIDEDIICNQSTYLHAHVSKYRAIGTKTIKLIGNKGVRFRQDGFETLNGSRVHSRPQLGS